MITDALIRFGGWIVHSLLGLIPEWTAPEWVTSAGSAIASVLSWVDSLSVWFPMRLLGVVAAAVTGAWLVSFGVKIVRIVASFLTAGGGSAA